MIDHIHFADYQN